MINTEKIKDLMRERGISQKEVANGLGIAQSTVCLKINNNRAMSLDEADQISKMLGISDLEFRKYFFA